jgi:hypothetical protein
MAEPVEQVFRGQVVEAEADADSRGDRDQLVATELLGQPGVTGEHHVEDGSGVEVCGGKDSQLGQDRSRHLLCLVDQEQRSVASRLDVCQPRLPQRLESSPSIVGSQGDAEELAELAVEVGDGALWPGQHADLDVAQVGQVVGQDSQRHGLAGTGVAGDQGEAALVHLVFDAPAEVLEFIGPPQRLGRDVGREWVPLESVKGQQVHDSSLGM